MNLVSKILVIVEGEKTDVKLMQKLFDIYGISESHQIISYSTNIYSLYQEMFKDGDPDSMDLLQLLKEKESDERRKQIFDERYSDILLIFDLDPQDPLYNREKISEMLEYFNESSDMGKLYINYPMVEAFYHMTDIPDEDYPSYVVSMDELKEKRYKKRVNLENRNHDYTKFAINRAECNIVIKQNIEKANMLIGKQSDRDAYNDDLKILSRQLLELERNKRIYVLCTCAFYIADYNSMFIMSD